MTKNEWHEECLWWQQLVMRDRAIIASPAFARWAKANEGKLAVLSHGRDPELEARLRLHLVVNG